MALRKDSLRFMDHPIHPIFTDFPIALWSLSVVWDIVALATGDNLWWDMAFWTIVAGLGMAIPTAITGLTDFLSIPTDRPAWRTALFHLLAMVTVVGLFAGSMVSRLGLPDLPAVGDVILSLALSWAGFLVLLLGAWLGGSLVYRHQMGTVARREALREAESRIRLRR